MAKIMKVFVQEIVQSAQDQPRICFKRVWKVIIIK
jgi:hypothetical protein